MTTETVKHVVFEDRGKKWEKKAADECQHELAYPVSHCLLILFLATHLYATFDLQDSCK